MRRLLALFVALIALAVPARAETKLIHAGTLFAVPGQEPLKEQTIVVKDGKIVEVKAGFVRASPGERVIDLITKFVLPGLIDCHVHILGELNAKSRLQTVEDEEGFVALRGTAFALRTLRAGFTTVRDLGERSSAIFALKRAINEGLIAGPQLVVAGSTLSPTGGHAQTYGYREEINALFYILRNDAAGRAFVDRLTARALQGGTVRLGLDRLGTLKRPRRELAALVAAGGEVRYVSPFLHLRNAGNLNLRNHRKLVLTDA